VIGTFSGAAATGMGPPAGSATTAPLFPWEPAVEPMPASSAPPHPYATTISEWGGGPAELG
jgi:hypothetical protein